MVSVRARFDQLVRVQRLRRELSSRDKWAVDQLREHQARALKELRDHAYASSPFYQKFHSGKMDRPLSELPVLTKAELMRNWDDIITDRSLKLAEVEGFLERVKGAELLRGRYHALTTSGSTGFKGVFVYDPGEWDHVLASYSRANDWIGVKVGLTKRLKVAVVSATLPWHQSAAVGLSFNDIWVPTLRIASTEDLGSIVAKLNRYRPRLLSAFSSMARVLALEQLAGRLRIRPEAVACVSEVLTEDTRTLIKQAWGVEATNVYSATETAGIASERTGRRGLHLYEDLVIVEPVDENNEPARPGEFSSKILVTVLFSRSLPLIRYEMNDSVMMGGERPKDSPFATLDGVQGRALEIITMDGTDARPVVVQPLFFHVVMERFEVEGWQIVQERRDALRVLVVNPVEGFSEQELSATMTRELSALGVREPVVTVERRPSLTRSALGKIILIKALSEPGQ